MFAYTKSLVKPTEADAAITCHFTSSDVPALIVASKDMLSVYVLRERDVADTETSIGFYLVLKTRFDGRILSMASFSKGVTGLDYVLLTFADAKMSVVEYDPLTNSISTVSMHYYEQEKWKGHLNFKLTSPVAKTDPHGRCAIMRFYNDKFAILPLHSSDLILGEDTTAAGQTPYSSSFVVDTTHIDFRIKNVLDFCFLHGYYEPTIAVLFENKATWPGRMQVIKDTVYLAIMSIDLQQHTFHLVHLIDKLPLDCFGLLAIPKPIGGVLIFGVNEVIHVDQGTVGTGCALNAFAFESTKFFLADKHQLALHLDGSSFSFLPPDRVLIGLRDGSLVELQLFKEGRSISKMEFRSCFIDNGEKTTRKTSFASVLVPISTTFVFLGSKHGDSLLLQVVSGSTDLQNQDGSVSSVEKAFKKPKVIQPPAQDDEEEDELAFLTEDVNEDQSSSNGAATATERLLFRVLDRLTVLAPISDIAVGTSTFVTKSLKELGVPPPQSFDLVAAVGYRETSAVAVLNNTVRPRIDSIFKFNQAEGEEYGRICSVRFKGTITEENPAGSQCFVFISKFMDDRAETIILDANQEFVEKRDGDFNRRMETVGVAAFFENTKLIQIVSNCVRMYNSSFKLVQEIKVFGGEMFAGGEGRKVVSCSIVEPYILLTVTDGSLILVQADADQKELVMVPITQQIHDNNVFRAVLIEDSRGALVTGNELPKVKEAKVKSPKRGNKRNMDDLELDNIYGSSSVIDISKVKHQETSVFVAKATKKSNNTKKWCFVYKDNGALEFRLHFQMPSFGLLPTLAHHMGSSSQSSSVSKGAKIQISDFNVVQLGFDDIPFILVYSQKGDLALYRAFTPKEEFEERSGDMLLTRFARISHESITCLPVDSNESQQLKPAPARNFLHAFKTNMITDKSEESVQAAFLCGPRPAVVCVGRQNGVFVHAFQEAELVPCFASISEKSFLYFDNKGNMKMGSMQTNVDYEFEKPLRRTFFNPQNEDDKEPMGVAYDTEKILEAGSMEDTPRTLRKVCFCPDSKQYCVLTSQDTPFFVKREDAVNEDENGMKMNFQQDDEEKIEQEKKQEEPLPPDVFHIQPGKYLPLTRRFSIDIVSPLTWTSIDRFNFALTENALTITTCFLDVRISGMVQKRMFTIVGTTFAKGEDVTARGKAYIFEVIEVVPEPGRPETNHKLKLVKKEDIKGPVSAVCALDGLLAISYGNKLMVYSFENGEKLTGIAFLDINFFVTSMRSIKRFLLVGDVHRSICLIGFQEEPAKLIVLGKDYHSCTVLDSDFLLDEGSMGIVVGDRFENIQILSYNPTHIASFSGQKLLRRSDFHLGSPIIRLLRICRRPPITSAHNKDNERNNESDSSNILQQHGCVFATVDGEIGYVVPIAEKTFKRLQDIHHEMVNRIEHPAGLNPKAYRFFKVPARFNAAPVKNILDGNYLYAYLNLAAVERMKWARSKGTSEDRVLNDLRSIALSMDFF